MATREQLGRNIRNFRKAASLTQAELAELADVTVETVSHVERGARGVSIDVLERFAKALEIEIKDLFPPGAPEDSGKAKGKAKGKASAFSQKPAVNAVCRILEAMPPAQFMKTRKIIRLLAKKS